MSKLPKIVAWNAVIFALYAGGLGVSYWLGISIDDLIKLVPTALASATANMITVTIALIAALKGTPNFEIGAPEQDEWSAIVPLHINCQGASGVRLDRIDGERLDFIEISEGTNRNVITLPFEVKAGQIAELYARFNVVKGNQNEIGKHRRLAISCIYFLEGKQTSRVISKKCSNVFRRK